MFPQSDSFICSSSRSLESRLSLISALQERKYGHRRFRANQDRGLELSSELRREPAVGGIVIRIFERIVMPIDFTGRGLQCARGSRRIMR